MIFLVLNTNAVVGGDDIASLVFPELKDLEEVKNCTSTSSLLVVKLISVERSKKSKSVRAAYIDHYYRLN
jgi:hypothetical protein